MHVLDFREKDKTWNIEQFSQSLDSLKGITDQHIFLFDDYAYAVILIYIFIKSSYFNFVPYAFLTFLSILIYQNCFHKIVVVALLQPLSP